MTIRDVAREAQVSVSTASRAFREGCYISEDKKERVLKAAAQLGYIPNQNARNLRYDHSMTVGLMLLDPENEFMNQFTWCIERQLREQGYKTIIAYNNKEENQERKCLEALLASRVDGVISYFISPNCADLVGRFVQMQVPILQVFSKIYDLYTIRIDDDTITCQTMQYLLELGHRNIFFPEYESNLHYPDYPANDSYTGLLRALKPYNLSVGREEFAFLSSNHDEILSQLRESLVRRKSSAFIATSSQISVLALTVIQSLGLRIPRDISFIAYDDNDWCSYLRLTALRHPLEALADEVARTMLRMLGGAIALEERRDVKFTSELVHRESVRPFVS